MSKTFLKIKIMSLAAEARVIRAEERKWPRQRDVPTGHETTQPLKTRIETRLALAHHRRVDVRSEARSAQLAYGFLRGLAYRRIEAKCYDVPNQQRVAEIIAKFGGLDKRQALAELKPWLSDTPRERSAA